MTLEQKFHDYRKDRPEDLIFGIVTSILLHAIFFLGYLYWLKITPEQKRSQSSPIPIEFVEVPPNPKQVKPPPQTQRRAANDSVAGGKANLKQPISAARLTPPVGERGRGGEGERGGEIPKPKSQIQNPQFKIPNPKSKIQNPKSPSIAQPKLAIRKVEPLRYRSQARTANEKIEAPPRRDVTPTAPKRVATRSSAKIPSSAQPRNGAASRLGGTMSVSSRNFQGYQTALANSNRLNRGTQGIDARRDVDMGSYLTQIQQRVRQQWIPGLTQSSQRTVVYFVVSRSGGVRGMRVIRPSGSSVTDQAAVGAISRAAPFAPLPAGYSGNYISIRFTFNINVSGQLELGVR